MRERPPSAAASGPSEVSQHEAAVGAAPERGDLDALAHGRREPGRVALEVRDDLVARHEAVGIVAVVGVPGELDGPVRRHQAEAVPPPPPRLPDAAPLQHDVRDAGLRQLVADRQPGLTAADDHDVDPAGSSRLRKPVWGDRAVVVEPQQRDHVADVVVASRSARA